MVLWDLRAFSHTPRRGDAFGCTAGAEGLHLETRRCAPTACSKGHLWAAGTQVGRRSFLVCKVTLQRKDEIQRYLHLMNPVTEYQNKELF